jgi:fructoselysine-6-P-deglycase FrlB-like protein
VIPDLFAEDLLAKPDVLTGLAAHLRAEDPWAGSGIDADSRLVLLGMGSSHYANAVAAARLRALGVDAVAELASSDVLPAAGRPRPSMRCRGTPAGVRSSR